MMPLSKKSVFFFVWCLSAFFLFMVSLLYHLCLVHIVGVAEPLVRIVVTRGINE